MTKLVKELNILVVTLVLLLTYPLAAQTTFLESAASYNLNISGNKDGGHAWADYDGDGDLDVLVLENVNGSTRSYLMRNNGNNTFTDVRAALVAGMGNDVAERQAAWGDLNNDGRPDFMITSHGNGGGSGRAALQIYLQNPVGNTFGDGIGGNTPITVGRSGPGYTININPINAEGAGFIDFEGDGDLDIFFDSHNYGIELLRNNYINHTTHTIVNPAPASLFSHITTGNGAGVVNFGLNQFATDGDYGTAADVNDDGWVDLFMRKRDENDFFLNQGGVFTSGTDLAQANNNNKGGNGLWDLDNDGDLDAVWTENGVTQIFRNDAGTWTALGGGVFPSLPQPANASNATSSAGIDALAGGDIDNDGDIDIILVGNSRSYLYINQLNSPSPAPGTVGSGTAMTFTLDGTQSFNVGANGEGTTMVDLDNDGDLDIYMNINGGANQLYINNLAAANRNNHLMVNVSEDRNPDGTTGGFSGRTAIGTNVLIKDCDGNIVSGLRQVNGVFGHGTQQSPLVHFGLPLGEGQTYLIEVHYPNLYNAAAGGITRLIATGVAQPSTIAGTNHYTLTTTDAETLQNPNAPDAVDDTENVTTNYNISVQLSLFDNDSEPDGDNFFIESIVQPAVGSVVIDDADTGLVTFTYTAGTAFAGTTFDYTISDAFVTLCPGAGKTDTATATINPKTPEDCTNGIDDDGDGLVDCDDPECNLKGNGYDWFFGQNAGLDFENSAGPFQVASPLMNAEEGCSVRSDEQGNLLFYTDGTTVYNRNHQIMPNGGGLSGGPSATQSGVIVKDPSNANRYYVFYINNAGSQSYYAIVDMTLNGGNGDVTTKNTVIQAVGGEKIAAWPHANGTDIWVVLVNQNNIYARLLTAGGLGAAVTTNVPSPGRRYGQMKFSPDGSQLAITCYPTSFASYQVQLVDFNNSTGQFSNLQSWALDEPYGVEFSPNGDYLYITDMGWASAPGRIMQYNILNNTTGATISASGVSILSANHLFASLQIAPDEKIYMATSVVGNNPRNGLAVINSPNSAGLAANAVDDQITFTGGVMSRSGLPNIPAYQLRPTPVITVADISQTCFINIQLQVQAFGATSFQWLLNGVAIPGETNSTIDPDVAGDYQVEVTYGCDTETTEVYTLIGDNDNDCVDDVIDIDDDNDGILDITESNGTDPGADADNDGIPNYQDADYCALNAFSVCTNLDSDSDGIPNHFDLDSDGDGIPDNVEAQITISYNAPSGNDTDGNGLDDNYETSPGSGEGLTVTNTDGTDEPDYLDTNSDNDALNDTAEAGIALNGMDIDNDGLDDGTDADTSGYSDPGGTIDDPLTAPLALLDSDNDATTGGDVDFRDAVDDRPDNDSDGIVDAEDFDDDNDGILDTDEGCGNLVINGNFEAQDFSDATVFPGGFTDASGTFIGATYNANILYGWNYTENIDGWVGGQSPAWSSDSFATAYQGNQYIDVVGNNNVTGGVNSILSQIINTVPGNSYTFSFHWGEDVGHATGEIITLDVDVIDAANNPLINQTITSSAQGPIAGIRGPRNWFYYSQTFTATTTQTTIQFQGTPPAGSTSAGVDIDYVSVVNSGGCQDTDNDGVIDAFDLDSDNDGIFDAVEAGHDQAHTNGEVNGSVGIDGIPDIVQDDPDNERVNYMLSNNDADTNPNFLDLDSDGDGIPDNVEAQTTTGYATPSGTVDANGVFTNYTTGLIPVNTDTADNPDYLDLDSDNEGANDTVEAGITLANNDADGDGLDDNTDATADYSDPAGTIDDPLSGGVILPDADGDATTGGDVDFRDAINEADLKLVKTVNNSNPDEGVDIIFTIAITNEGTSPANLIEVRDIIPTDFTYTHPNYVTSQGTVSFNAGSRALDWDLGAFNLPVGDTITLQYTVTVDVCGEFVNEAEIMNSSLLDPDSTPGNGQ